MMMMMMMMMRCERIRDYKRLKRVPVMKKEREYFSRSSMSKRRNKVTAKLCDDVFI
jgi:hypothetical protein